MAAKNGLRRWASLGEAALDRRIARELFDRVCEAEIAWLQNALPLHRDWASELSWKDARTPVGQFGFRFGKFDGLPKHEDAYALFKHAVQCLMNDVECLVVVRDSDGRAAARRDALVEAMKHPQFPSGVTVVVGTPDYEIEAWVLAGYVPEPNEQQLVDQERTSLSFDPLTESHRLAAKNDHELKSAKRCLHALSNGDRRREERCWLETPIATLKERGMANGLAEFLTFSATAAQKLFG